MAFWQTDFFIARQGPQNRDSECLDGSADKASVTRACDPVQDHPGDFYARVEAGAALNNGSRRLRLPADVEHEQNRPAECRCDIGGRAGAARLSGTPSKSPIKPSQRISSQASPAATPSSPSCAGVIAQLSRLKLCLPVAAAWKAGRYNPARILAPATARPAFRKARMSLASAWSCRCPSAARR